jgi:hypothetical protein
VKVLLSGAWSRRYTRYTMGGSLVQFPYRNHDVSFYLTTVYLENDIAKFLAIILRLITRNLLI